MHIPLSAATCVAIQSHWLAGWLALSVSSKFALRTYFTCLGVCGLAILRSCAVAVIIRYAMVNTEMHKLCCNRTWDEVKRRIESHPQEAREENHGNLPLHYALGGNASVDVIGKLLAAYPGGAQVKNTDGDLPLHWAVYKGSGDVIDILILTHYP